MVQEGQSVFFTGSAGTGKSVLLREIIRSCKRQGMRIGKQLAVTAATGIASVNIGGKTLHSWAGIGLGREEPEVLLKNRSSPLTYRSQDGKPKPYPSYPAWRWKKVQTLIVDEISMIDGKLLDKLEHIARIVRQNDLSFGGIQVGHQLPVLPDILILNEYSLYSPAISVNYLPFHNAERIMTRSRLFLHSSPWPGSNAYLGLSY
ncbi:hypothetical protein OE88DRAFT_159450 [Heliocybe sulcata]|uniref:ATP-dependent DNA helicase n=1 Tax=Heliocybe sulcata TaxID=5364 RepID=A0A5C3NLA9_9AGAM|nr:hypothetical protein OE88DRAFT_159450 [Heliocybe sulcata]